MIKATLTAPTTNSGHMKLFESVKKQLPLPDINFPTAPIETYRQEIDGVFHLLNSLN